MSTCLPALLVEHPLISGYPWLIKHGPLLMAIVRTSPTQMGGREYFSRAALEKHWGEDHWSFQSGSLLPALGAARRDQSALVGLLWSAGVRCVAAGSQGSRITGQRHIGTGPPRPPRPPGCGDCRVRVLARLAPVLDGVRLSLHVLAAAAIWIGGLITVAGLVPTARRLGEGAPREVARAFSRLSWRAYAVLLATGISNVVEGTSWNTKQPLVTNAGALLEAGELVQLQQRSTRGVFTPRPNGLFAEGQALWVNRLASSAQLRRYLART